jgi:hypothetical protein
VALFGHYCDGQVIFVATRHPRPSGEELSFTITLAGGEPLIVATGRVEGSYPDGAGPHGRAGMLIRFHDVAAGSRALVDELASVPPPTAGFARGTEPPGMAVPGRTGEREDSAEPDSETFPAGLPRSMVGNRARVTPSHVVVPRPPSPLVVKPAATPPPILLEQRIGRDDDPTGVKPMESIVRARVRYADDERGEPRGWDEHGEHHDEGRRASRVALRADALGRLDASSLEALADCAVFEENAVCDERGLPTAATAPVTRGQEDAWDDDETIPPWLRGPQPDEVMDAQTGSIEIEAVPESPIGRIAGRVEFHDPAPIASEPLPPPAPSPPLPPLTFSTARSLELEPPAAMAADLSAIQKSEEAMSLRRRGRWALVLGASLLSAGVGLAVGYAVGTGGLLTGAGAEPRPATPKAASQGGQGGDHGEHGNDPAAAAPPAPAATAAAPDVDDDEGATSDGAAADDADAREADGKPDEADDDDSERSGRGKKSKKANGRERALARDRCGAEVESDPSGSEIVVAGEVLGTTPGRIELPCGAHEVEVRRTRYQSALRRLRLRPGRLEKMDVRLERPDHKLRITTTPPGAAVTVNGRPAGLTPVVANVRGYQHIRVRIERPGFESWAEKVYARDPLTKVTVKLNPVRGGIIPQGRPSIELSPSLPAPPAAPAAPAAADAGVR